MYATYGYDTIYIFGYGFSVYIMQTHARIHTGATSSNKYSDDGGGISDFFFHSLHFWMVPLLCVTQNQGTQF